MRHLQDVVLARGGSARWWSSKQIIGPRHPLRDDYGKLFFNIVDYTGSAN